MRKLHKKLYIVAVAALTLALLCACGKPAAAPETSAQPTSESTPVPTATPATPSPRPTPTATPAPTPRPERVDDAYFADAAFFGNSLMDGLHSFGGLKCGTFFAGTSASVISVRTTTDARLRDGTAATMLDALLETQYGKIYVLLGINELGYDQDGFIALYTELLSDIRAGEPDAQVFVLSLTPITAKKSNAGGLFTQERVQAFNAAIRAMAEEQGYVYLDLFEALSDREGYLPEKHSSDGIHFTVDTYLDWAEYLRRNYDGAAEDVTFYKDETSEVIFTPPVTPAPTPTPTPTPPAETEPPPEETEPVSPASPSDLN